MQSLSGKKVAILAADGFEQSELIEPKKALDRAGAKTVIVSPNPQKIRGWKDKNWGEECQVDEPLERARPDEFDALLLPGGVMNPDTLRQDRRAVQFAKYFFRAGKPVAAICHGAVTLIDAEVVAGRLMTSYPAIQKDLKNAGAKWVDEEVVVDHGFVTSRKPADLPRFIEKMIEEFAEGIHEPPPVRPEAREALVGL